LPGDIKLAYKQRQQYTNGYDTYLNTILCRLPYLHIALKIISASPLKSVKLFSIQKCWYGVRINSSIGISSILFRQHFGSKYFYDNPSEALCYLHLFTTIL